MPLAAFRATDDRGGLLLTGPASEWMWAHPERNRCRTDIAHARALVGDQLPQGIERCVALLLQHQQAVFKVAEALRQRKKLTPAMFMAVLHDNASGPAC